MRRIYFVLASYFSFQSSISYKDPDLSLELENVKMSVIMLKLLPCFSNATVTNSGRLILRNVSFSHDIFIKIAFVTAI